MPASYKYKSAILGSQSQDGSGMSVDYQNVPTSGQWSYSGPETSFTVDEKNANNSDFEGDRPDDKVQKDTQINKGNEQTTDIDGSQSQVLWDYTFRVIDENGQTYDIGVVDVDLNNDNDVTDSSEAGYYLVFIDGVPPPDTPLDVVGLVEDEREISHAELGGTIVCFAEGTLIETSSGLTAIETLGVDDQILTRDHGFQTLRWIGKTEVLAVDDFAPVVISANVFGNNEDLVVSPQHGLLMHDWRAELLYADPNVLVRAKDLTDRDGVYRLIGGRVTYYHLLFDAHQLVKAAGMWSESLYPGDMARQSVNPAACAEIEKLVPDIEAYGPKAARYLRHFEVACLAA